MTHHDVELDHGELRGSREYRNDPGEKNVWLTEEYGDQRIIYNTVASPFPVDRSV